MDAEKVSKHIVNWLKSYAENAKVNGFVVGGLGSIIGCPMHYVKINMQLNKTNNYNTLDFVKYTLKNGGFIANGCGVVTQNRRKKTRIF